MPDELPPILIHRIRADYQASKIPANQWDFMRPRAAILFIKLIPP